MKIKLQFLAALFLGVLLPVAVGAAPETPVVAAASISQISVQRTWCYGPCPIDAATFNSDGSATYAGFESAPRRGFYRGTLLPDQFSALVSFLESQNFFELRAEIGDDMTTDVPYFLVSAVRGGVPYNVTFRPGSNPVLQAKMEKQLVAAMETVKWQRDEAASASGVRGTARRSLTRSETRIFSDRKPPIESSVMRFALIRLRSLDRPSEAISTRSDQEGRFQFFAPPGRYELSTPLDFSMQSASNRPLYLAEAQPVMVEAAKVAAPTVKFEDYNQP